MNYTIQNVYQKAIKFAGEKHYNQSVPSLKANYLLHLSNVAMEVFVAYNHNPNFNLEYAIQLALLHDTLEDTNTTFQELEKVFNPSIALGIQALTKNQNLSSKKEKMNDSLKRINQMQKEVGLVKLADRITNLQTPPAHWDRLKIKQYHQEAIHIANTLKDKNAYLNQRLEQKIKAYSQYL